MTNCIQACPSETPIRDESVLYLNVACFDGRENVTLKLSYRTCPKDRLYHETKNDDYLYCKCITSLFDQCTPTLHQLRSCHVRFEVLVFIQLVIIVSALILNAGIVHAYLKSISLRRKNPNMLLVLQAMVDIVSCLVYALPNAVILKVKGDPIRFYALASSTLALTVLSSLFIFVIIATERFLSLHKPMWHRANATKHMLWRAVLLTWFTSTLLAVLAIIVKDHELVYMYYKLVLLVVMIFVVISTTALHIWSFMIAYQAVHSHSNNTDTTLQARKELRLIILFITMYIIFIIGFTPIQIVLALNYNHYSLHCQTLCSIFTLTSVMNPLLTLCLKAKFRTAMVGGISKRFVNMIGCIQKPSSLINMTNGITQASPVRLVRFQKTVQM